MDSSNQTSTMNPALQSNSNTHRPMSTIPSSSRPSQTPLLLEHILIRHPSATPVEQFTLDPSVFNQSLYGELISFWFAGLNESSTHADAESMRKWLRHGASEAQAKDFDVQCRQRFGHAIEAVGPEVISLPPFRSYADDRARAEELAAPFLTELRRARCARRAADTLLALVLLLDQIPRNVHRTPVGLKKVYGHYDRMAFALLHAGLALGSPKPSAVDNCESVSVNINCDAYRIVYRSWLFVPLLHAEDLESQLLLEELWRACKAEMVACGDSAGEKFTDNRLGAARRHLVIVYQFGRFPHRNEGLGRLNTPEEAEYIRTGGETFGVKQVQLRSRL